MNVIRDPLDELLKADAAELRATHIDDGGFTLSVMDALPTQKRVSVRARFAIPFGLATAAACITALFTTGGNFFVDGFMDIATQTMTGNAFALIAFLGAMAVAGVLGVAGER